MPSAHLSLSLSLQAAPAAGGAEYGDFAAYEGDMGQQNAQFQDEAGEGLGSGFAPDEKEQANEQQQASGTLHTCQLTEDSAPHTKMNLTAALV